MNNQIKFQKFHPDYDNHLLEGLVNCYRSVFADEPWNEWKKCTLCGQKWGISESEKLKWMDFRCCGKELIDFWPKEKVKEDIQHEISSDSFCLLALDDENVIGFCWGYLIHPMDLEEKTELSRLSSIIISKFGDESVGYQDEIGVLPSYRDLRIGKFLHRERLNYFRGHDAETAVTRTKSNPPTVTFHWYQRIGYKIIAEYHDIDGRVILAARLKDIIL